LKNRLTIAHGKFLATPNANRCLNFAPPMKPVLSLKAFSFMLSPSAAIAAWLYRASLRVATNHGDIASRLQK
jgi:hypothetical protein